jgi:hypothetical protein
MRKSRKGDATGAALRLPVGGLESEFTLLVDDRPVRPEDVFGDPRGFLNVPLMHRTGRSFHLPTGAAVYFDTGVIEIATPVMELERGCFLRLSRSLADALAIVRAQLDEWEGRTAARVRLQGFSTHYNVSVPAAAPARFDRLAWTLAHVLPAPVMLLATNRLSTGVGVRPRPGRIEVTADYSPDPLRIAATGAVIAGIVDTVRMWPRLTLESLADHGAPVLDGFAPMPHTSRRGWLARFDCYPVNPFACHVDAAVWTSADRRISLRTLAREAVAAFDGRIRALADPASYRLARRILSGHEASWLDAHARPAAYDDAGRGSDRVSGDAEAGRSRYERVVRNAVARRPLLLDDEWWTPVKVRGWSHVVLRRQRDAAVATRSLDALVDYLAEWERER